MAVLSRRQREIADLIAGGYTNKAICAELGIGLRSLRTHLQRMVAKLEIDQSKVVRVQIARLVMEARHLDSSAAIPA